VLEQAQRRARKTLDHALGLQVQLHGFQPPTGRGACREQRCGQVRQQRLLRLRHRHPGGCLGKARSRACAHGHVLGAIHALDVPGRGDALDLDPLGLRHGCLP
jgi:hypothetical protein